MNTPAQPDAGEPTPTPREKYPLLKRLLKIAAWTAMGIFLLFTAASICTVMVLTPQRLTPVVERVASKYLDAEIEMSRVELKIRGTYPFLRLEIDSLSVLPRSMRRLSDGQRKGLPAYADTLFRFDRLSGSINIYDLLKGKINLHDVEISGPQANIVVVGPNVNNFNIFPESTDTTSSDTIAAFPPIVLDQFKITNPKGFRYLDMPSNTYGLVELSVIELEGRDAPLYQFHFNGDFETPLLGDFNLSRFPFGINGTIEWHPAQPGRLGLKDFKIDLAYTRSRLDANLEFGENLVVNSFDYELEPLALTDLLSTVPDSLKTSWGIGDELQTTAKIGIGVKLVRPFNTGVETIPWADIAVAIPPSTIDYGATRFTDFGFDITAETRGDDINGAIIHVNSFTASTQGAHIEFAGDVTNFKTDLAFDGHFKSSLNLARLPYKIRRLFDGYIRGAVAANLEGKGRISMFNKNNSHKLKLNGGLSINDLLWIKSDTTNLCKINRAKMDFNTNSLYTKSNGMRGDSLLKVTVTADSIVFYHKQYDIKGTGLKFEAGTIRDSNTRDSLKVSPFGGRLRLGGFDMTVMTDSFGIRVRDIDGMVMMKRFKDLARVPEFVLDLKLHRAGAGGTTAKMLITDSHLRATAHPLPTKPLPAKVKFLADSIKVEMPNLPPDSVLMLAVEKARKNRKPYPRVHAKFTSEEREIIDWGTSSLLRKLLNNWKIEGDFLAERAGLYTPYFPVRNRLRNLNVTFNNDSIILKDIEYKVGNSDFMVSGVVSNLRRSLTSNGFRSPLKVHFATLSDTIDINQLTSFVFAGARYTDERNKMLLSMIDINKDSDDALAKEIGKTVQNAPGGAAPLMIPVNIEADIGLKARNVMYSDLLLHDFNGDLLIYDGTLNLHRLEASSSAGKISLSALYDTPAMDSIKFAFGLNVNRFNIRKFAELVPPVDSVFPMLRDFAGIIDAEVAASVDINKNMDFILPSFNAVVKISGDSLRLIDDETFKKIGKWLLFKNKNRNIINDVSVSLVIQDNKMEVFPFVFNFDRYRLGVQGYNDFAMNFNYRVSVLKSPIPFKFGVNIKGDPKHVKVRFGGPKFNEKTALVSEAVADTTRINLLKSIGGVFTRGMKRSRFSDIYMKALPKAASINLDVDTITAADSVAFMKEGLIPTMPLKR